MNVSEAQLWISYAKSDLDAAYTLLEKGDFFPYNKRVNNKSKRVEEL